MTSAAPRLLRLGSALSLVLLWQVAAWWWPSSLLPTPLAVLDVAMHDALHGPLLHDLGATLRRVALAFLIAMLAGSAIGILMGRRRTLDLLLDPWLMLFLNLPALVVIILAYVWFGLAESTSSFNSSTSPGSWPTAWPSSWSCWRSSMGYCFQNPRLLPWLTLRGNIDLVLDDPAARAAAVDTLLTTMGLAAVGHFPANRLSVGMQRRAALARAFAVQPRLLLMDEPFVSLDAPTAGQLRGLLLDLCERQRPTVIFVTHDLYEATLLADRLLFLSARPPGSSARSRSASRAIGDRRPWWTRVMANSRHCSGRCIRMRRTGLNNRLRTVAMPGRSEVGAGIPAPATSDGAALRIVAPGHNPGLSANGASVVRTADPTPTGPRSTTRGAGPRPSAASPRPTAAWSCRFHTARRH